MLSELVAGREREWVTAYEVAVVNALLDERDAACSAASRRKEVDSSQ
jgi:hypothetical protein